MTSRLFYISPKLDETNSDLTPEDPDGRHACEMCEANLIASLCDDGQHMPVIDIDLPCQLVPSSTEGHSHLYLDIPMSFEQFMLILGALQLAGVVTERYVSFVRKRGMSFVRPPWVKKPKQLAEPKQLPVACATFEDQF